MSSASAVPTCNRTRNGRNVGAFWSTLHPNRCGMITAWPRLLTGKSSVTPCTTASTIAWKRSDIDLCTEDTYRRKEPTCTGTMAARVAANGRCEIAWLRQQALNERDGPSIGRATIGVIVDERSRRADGLR